MGDRLYVGTSGWTYPHWRHVFYPPTVPVSRWLEFYARRFATVELNNPFYRLPAPHVFEQWRRAVPPQFVFAVKTSRYLTHLKRLKQPAAPFRRFLLCARRLGPALGPVLVQLPAQFHANLERLDGLLGVLARQHVVPGLRVVLEVRHTSWLVPDVFERLTRANVALCFHDWRAAPTTGPLTADFVYVRRHGTPRRYGGVYSSAQLSADARAVQAWLQQGRDIYVYFNNDRGGAAVRNAATLAGLLRSATRRQTRQVVPIVKSANSP